MNDKKGLSGSYKIKVAPRCPWWLPIVFTNTFAIERELGKES